MQNTIKIWLSCCFILFTSHTHSLSLSPLLQVKFCLSLIIRTSICFWISGWEILDLVFQPEGKTIKIELCYWDNFWTGMFKMLMGICLSWLYFDFWGLNISLFIIQTITPLVTGKLSEAASTWKGMSVIFTYLWWTLTWSGNLCIHG